MALLNQWKTEVQGTPLLSGNKAPVTANCSSHWFTERKGVAAVGWYEQGTRLLDVRNPRNIQQVGYWLPPNAVTWGAYWITDDLVYTADVGRGIDVLRVTGPPRRCGGSAVAVAPIRASWLGAGPRVDLVRPTALGVGLQHRHGPRRRDRRGRHDGRMTHLSTTSSASSSSSRTRMTSTSAQPAPSRPSPRPACT